MISLSKSKYTKGVQCPKILWMDKYMKEEAEVIDNSSVLDNGTKVGELAKDLFGFHFDVSFNENLNTMINDTKALLLNKKVVITEASFNYDNNFCSVDILKKDNDNYEIYEVKSSTSVHDIYLDDVSYQYYVLTSLGYNVTKASIVYINNQYVREENLDIHKLFNIEDVTSIAILKQDEIADRISYLREYVSNQNEPVLDIDMNCFNPYECPYFGYCSGHLDHNTIFQIRRMQMKKKMEYYKKGLYKFEDLINSDLSDKDKMQIDYSLNNKEDYIDKKAIKSFLNELSYPLYFLDFETYQESVPSYVGLHPYEQIPFQYSLHYILEEGGEVLHKEFLAEDGKDPRRYLAERLVKDIPLNVCTLAYNMSFERTVIKNLAELFPDLSEHLLNIRENMKDLMVPFYNREYYSKDMEGSYSIKYVLPALFPNEEELNYHNLEYVHKGDEASNAFLNMSSMSKEEKEKYRNALLKYCKLDTYAMVKIYQKLIEVTKS